MEEVLREAYTGALSLAELACNAKDKIRTLLADGKIEDADKLRISIVNLGSSGLLEKCLIELFNELTFQMILDARVAKETK